MDRIAVFARRPVAGAVKTRLSPALPPALACALYRAMLGDALAAAAAAPAGSRAVWWADPPRPDAAFGVPTGFEERIQHGADLGERLAGAFAALLVAPGDRALVLGADCPDLETAALAEALERLDTHDVVLGPANDGGYTLIALARPAPALFEGVAWSTAHVLEQTLARARAADLRVALLEPLADLDAPATLVRWLGEALHAPPERAPRTRAALVAMGLLVPGRA